MRNIWLTHTVTAVVALTACNKSKPEVGAAPAPPDASANAAEAASTAASGDLTKMLSDQFGMSSNQAQAGIGAILAYAEGKLPSADYQKVAAALPGASENVQVAKDAGAVTGPITDQVGLNSALNQLGINPGVAGKFIPAVSSYIGKVGGPEVSQIMQGLFP
jgi:uncharacterized protein VcgC/VcgE DUF2780